MTWLLPIRALFGKAWGFIVRYPWPTLFVALAIFAAWLWIDRSHVKADLASEQVARKADRADYDRKYAMAQAAADKARKDAQESANAADKTHDALLEDNAGLERYISDHRVQPKACPANPPATGSIGVAEVPAQPTTEPVVAISEPDIRACDGAYVYARSAYEWGQSLMDRGLAK